MKQLTEYNRVSGYLNKIFNLLNERFFENALSKPVITIQSTPRAYGHVTVGKVWKDEKGNYRHELNIGAGTLSRPIENICGTLVHEMVHLYCLANNIQDVSRGGTYHNKRFKAEAEKRGLLITHDPRIGFSITAPADDLLQFVLDNDLIDILLQRDEYNRHYTPTGTSAPNGANTPPAPPAKSSTRKYVCPVCRCSVRATRELLLICGECHKASGNLVHLVKA